MTYFSELKLYIYIYNLELKLKISVHELIVNYIIN
jgi:hypothetical protein